MSQVVRSVRGMTDRRRARRAKQVRRDDRRTKKCREGSPADPPLDDLIRRTLRGHPLRLLQVASLVIEVAEPDTLPWVTSRASDTSHWDAILPGLIGIRTRETTALLAVIAQLVVDDPATQLRCRQEVAERKDHLPRWIAGLPRADAYRAVRRTNAFGDVDEIVIGMRLDDGRELTIGAWIDHNKWSSISDAGAVPEPIAATLARLAAESSSDTQVFEMTLADARVWIEDALNKPAITPKTDTWPLCRPLVLWLLSRLPGGGQHRPSVVDLTSDAELCDRFFASSFAAPFTDVAHRQLLIELFETGTRDPLRWSAARVENALNREYYDEYGIPLEVALDAPDLLRAFIPYAHAQSGIRDGLTSRTLAVVDALRSDYKRDVLRRAEQHWGLDDAV